MRPLAATRPTIGERLQGRENMFIYICASVCVCVCVAASCHWPPLSYPPKYIGGPLYKGYPHIWGSTMIEHLVYMGTFIHRDTRIFRVIIIGLPVYRCILYIGVLCRDNCIWGNYAGTLLYMGCPYVCDSLYRGTVPLESANSGYIGAPLCRERGGPQSQG